MTFTLSLQSAAKVSAKKSTLDRRQKEIWSIATLPNVTSSNINSSNASSLNLDCQFKSASARSNLSHQLNGNIIRKHERYAK
jgi:hypothetical protein